MTIHRYTTVQAYQLRKGGTRARMAILRMMAADSVNNRNEATRLQPGDWRGARHYTFRSYAAAYGFLSGGFNGDEPVWYEHTGDMFRDVRAVHEVVSTHHRGWFTDSHGNETAHGIVARLTHGRFIAGYEWTSNGERVWFGQVFTDEEEAAHMADEHARVFAESEKEDADRFDAMQDAEQHAEDVAQDVLHAFQARNVSEWHREHCRDRIEELKAARSDAKEAGERYERG